MKPVLVVMAAGMGSRYGGIKQIEPVGPTGEAIIDYSIYDAVQAGFSEVIFIIRKSIEKDFKKYIGSRFADKIKVSYCYQQLESRLPEGFSVPEKRDKPWGTGHAVLCAEEQTNAPFAVINADDFYGSDAFKKAAEFLQNTSVDSSSYAMVGYPISNTLSDFGSVSRGLCEFDESRFLTSIEEHVKISKEEGAVISRQPAQDELILTGKETVSMNFWCLTPVAFSSLDNSFARFLKEKGSELKSEIYLPAVLGELIDKKEATVKVLNTDSHWFGVTYQEDKPLVVENIKKLIEAGAYPQNLWG